MYTDRRMSVLAQLRRLYHHMVYGGMIQPEDLSRLIKILEEDMNKLEEL